MFTRIVVGIDGSHTAEIAAQAAISLAVQARAEVHLVSVIEEQPQYVAAREASARESADARAYFTHAQEELLRMAAQRNVTANARTLVGHEARQLLTYLTEAQADLLVIGFAGHSALWGSALGGTAHQLARHAPCSVLVVRAQSPTTTFARLAVALDGSPLGWEAFAVGLELAHDAQRTLNVLSVVEGIAPSSQSTSHAMGASASGSNWQSFLLTAQARATARAVAAGVATEVTTRLAPVSEALVNAANELDLDALILGATGNERPWNQVAGATAMKVVEEAPCAVLLVRPQRRGAYVRESMTLPQRVARPETPLADALATLLAGDVRLVPVVADNNTLLGVLTLGTLLRRIDPALATHLAGLHTADHVRRHVERVVAGHTVGDTMLTRPYVVQPQTPLDVAGRYLTTHRITRAPVVDTTRHLVGMLSERDVITTLLAIRSAPEKRPLIGATEESVEIPAPLSATDATDVGAGMPTAQHVMEVGVPLAPESASLDEMIQAVQAAPGGIAFVVDADGRVRGLLDERVLLEFAFPALSPRWGMALLHQVAIWPAQTFAALRSHPDEPVTATRVMRPATPTMPAETPLPEALARMMAVQPYDVAIITTPDGKPLGLLRRHTALRALTRG